MIVDAVTVLVPLAVAIVPVPISIFCNSYASKLLSYVVHIVQLRLLGASRGIGWNRDSWEVAWCAD